MPCMDHFWAISGIFFTSKVLCTWYCEIELWYLETWGATWNNWSCFKTMLYFAPCHESSSASNCLCKRQNLWTMMNMLHDLEIRYNRLWKETTNLGNNLQQHLVEFWPGRLFSLAVILFILTYRWLLFPCVNSRGEANITNKWKYVWIDWRHVEQSNIFTLSP